MRSERCDAYLSKPIRSEQLHETVDNLLDRSEYDSLLQEYYALVEKQATLEATKSSAELAESSQYDELSRESRRCETTSQIHSVASTTTASIATLRGERRRRKGRKHAI